MASKFSSSISDPVEQNRVDKICSVFNHQPYVKFRTCVSIFNLPEIIKTQKPEAYEPQQIGLGPNYHHQFRSYKELEQIKLSSVHMVLQNKEIKNFEVVLEEVLKLVPYIRSCYNEFLIFDDYSLAWIFAIDGIYLLHLLHSYGLVMDYEKERSQLPYQHTILKEIDSKRRLLVKDIMMEENQIPVEVLIEICKALHLTSGSSHSSVIKNLSSIFRSFCEVHTPLELCSPDDTFRVDHLLQYMYLSIIWNVPLEPSKKKERKEEKRSGKKEQKKDEEYPLKPRKKGEKKDDKKSDENPRVTWLYQTNEFLGSFPRNEIVQLYKNTVATLETFSQSKPDIPSASKLHDRAGFSFHLLPKDTGIRKIDIKGKDFYLPCVTLNNESEVIFRNLVAYEMLIPTSNNFPLGEYMSLMCGLITTANDVKLLKKENIIKGELPENEVVQLFVGMSSSISSMKTKTKTKSSLQLKIEEVDKIYESRPRVKMILLLKKLAYWLLVSLRAFGGFVEVSWKVVTFMASIATVFLLTLQAYCDVYGCYKTNFTLVPS